MSAERVAADAARLIRAIEAGLIAFPGMRVGQLLDNAVGAPSDRAGSWMFYIPDAELASRVEAYVATFAAQGAKP